MAGVGSEELHHTFFPNCNLHKLLANEWEWSGTHPHVLLLVHVLGLVHAVHILHRIPSEKKLFLQFSQSSHLWKPSRVKNPLFERSVELKAREITIFPFNKIKPSPSWDWVHHWYCACAPDSTACWPPSFFFSFSFLKLLHVLLFRSASTALPRCTLQTSPLRPSLRMLQLIDHQFPFPPRRRQSQSHWKLCLLLSFWAFL